MVVQSTRGRPCSLFNGEIVGCAVALLVVPCSFFVLVARCNVGFVLEEMTLTHQIMTKYTNSSVSFMGGTSSSSSFFGQ